MKVCVLAKFKYHFLRFKIMFTTTFRISNILCNNEIVKEENICLDKFRELILAFKSSFGVTCSTQK